MAKWLKIVLLLLVVSAVITLAIKGLVDILWDGSFDNLFVSEIATYDSPDGKYTLVFEQVGSPTWPFGPVDVRLKLKDSQGGCLDTFCTDVWNDGGSAGVGNIKCIQWGEDTVTVILDRGEQRDQGFTFFYDKSKPSAINPIT